MRRTYITRFLASLFISIALCHVAPAAELKQKTTTAFDRYVTATEARFTTELRPDGTFLYIDGMNPDARRQAYDQLRQGEILVETLETKASGVSSDIPDGMLHHWVGLIFIPDATLAIWARLKFSDGAHAEVRREKNKGWKEKGAVPLELGAGLAVYLASAESDGITGKLISAQWDPWQDLQKHREELAKSDIYCLRRITPKDRGQMWGDK